MFDHIHKFNSGIRKRHNLFVWAFVGFKKLEMTQWIEKWLKWIKLILENRFFKCVGGGYFIIINGVGLGQNLQKCEATHWQQIGPTDILNFSSTHAISTPVKLNFWVFHLKLFSASSRGNVISIFWFLCKVCRKMSTYPNAHANTEKWIFDIQYPGNRLDLVLFQMIF